MLAASGVAFIALAQSPAVTERQASSAPEAPAAVARSKPSADRVAITFTTATGDATRTVVTARWDVGNVGGVGGEAGGGAPPRLRLSMGRLDISVSKGRLIATSRSDATTYFESTLPDPITPESIRSALPPIPLPHIQWCFGSPEQRDNPHPMGVSTTLVSKGDDGLEQFSASDGTLNVWKSGSPLHPRRIDFRGTNGTQLYLALTPIDVRPDDQWEISIEGRRRVSSLAELRVDKAAPMIGRPMKDLGFTAPDLSDVSLAELLAPNPNAKNPNASQASILLVVASTKDGMPVESANSDFAAARNAIDGAIESLHLRDADTEIRARVKVIVLRGLPLAELDVNAALVNATKLAEPLEASTNVPRVRNTTSADWVLKDQLGECSLAVLVVDGSRIVVHASPLDARAQDAEAVRAELLAALEKALAIAPPVAVPPVAPPATPTDPTQPTTESTPRATPAPR